MKRIDLRQIHLPDFRNVTMENVISKTTDTNNRLIKHERLLRFFLALAAAIILLGIYFWNPNLHPLTICKFHELTGVSCPTCGLSRSIQAVTHFHFLRSLKFNAMGMVIIAGIVFFLGWTIAEAARGKKFNLSISSRQKKLIFFGIISLWILSWLINIARDLNFLRW